MQDGTNVNIDMSDDLSQVEDLFSYLYSDDPNVYIRSKDNLNKLIKSYNKNTTVSFIGAGTSKPLGISDWETLMRSLFEKASSSGFSSNFPNKPQRWPQLAQEIFEYFKNNGTPEKYFDTISQKMMPRNNTTTLTLVKMVLALNVHLTTNFDNSIENAYKFLDYLSKHFKRQELKKRYGLNYLPDFQLHLKTDDSLIYYLHGNINNNTYILKKSDYDTFYPTVSGSQDSVDSLENFLKDCYKNCHIVFFGLSFHDYYVKEFFLNLAKEIEREDKIVSGFYTQSGQSYPGKDIEHFLITDAGILDEYEGRTHDFFQEINIYSIIYKSGKHIFLEKFFEGLAQRINP